MFNMEYISAIVSHSTWVDSSFDGADEAELENQKISTQPLWLEFCDALATEDGADMTEQFREDKLDIVTDLSARVIAE